MAGCVTSAYNFTGQDVEERPSVVPIFQDTDTHAQEQWPMVVVVV